MAKTEALPPMRWVALFTITISVGWLSCLSAAALTGRGLYADGAWLVLWHLINPGRFHDPDVLRAFSSFISQAPLLAGQRLGARSVAAYAALYIVGTFALPAAAFVCSLIISRRHSVLFASTAAAIVVFGFGANFVYTEANTLFAFAWLAMTLLALEKERPLLRGAGLPALAFVLLGVYEGMLLVGPILAGWSLLRLRRTSNTIEQSGLLISALLFGLGSVIGLGGFLAPRDPVNAAAFVSNVFAYFRNPQVYLLLSAAMVLPSTVSSSARWRGFGIVAGAAFGMMYLRALWNLHGYYSYAVYYENRSFLVLFLPICVAALWLLYAASPGSLGAASVRAGVLALLIPFAAAASGDLLGSYRWNQYMTGFCRVLADATEPYVGADKLSQAGYLTGWGWTHPTMSALLRERGSSVVVVNKDPQRWQPFDPSATPSLREKGFCENRRGSLASKRQPQ